MSPTWTSARLAMALLPLSLAATTVQAQEQPSAYPSRNIILIIPYPPGGPPDVVARVLGPVLGDILGRPIVIENRPGASTSIAAAAVARAAPDGYTLLASDIAQTVAPSILVQPNFDPIKNAIGDSLLILQRDVRPDIEQVFARVARKSNLCTHAFEARRACASCFRTAKFNSPASPLSMPSCHALRKQLSFSASRCSTVSIKRKASRTTSLDDA